MQTLTEQLIELGLADRIINDRQLERIIEGPPVRRYGLVNRAIKHQELRQIRRGLYALADRYRSQPVHPFALAQALVPGSYVSFETALAYHGWIPEAVYTTASAAPGRKSKHFENDVFGSFSFHPLAIQPGYFLELVERQQSDTQTMLIAKPIRALMDLVCLRKTQWQGLEWLTEGMRIEEEDLETVTEEDIEILKLIYKLDGFPE
jgi:predicted transcriptional regulator of viral defense system